MTRLNTIAYWVSTGILLFLLAWAAGSYHLIHDTQAAFFEAFGYPTYLVYPLAYLKIAAILIIVSHRYNDLRDMAYAAYFLNMILALVGHIIYGDFFGHAVVGLLCLPVSYLLGNKVRGRPARNFFGKWTDPSE
ncbi:MAG: DoxX family protein [Erythrobacter sp.]